MTLPLQGIKVIDMSQVYFGPGGAVYLADQGADVIKIETIRGDAMRHRYTTPYLTQWNMSKPFLSLNRNKKSISLDIRTDEGKKIVSQLCETADVFILNMRPGTEKQFELDFESLFKSNPKLIYVSISGFGSEGPDASLPGYDIVLQAKSGVLSLRKFPDGTPVPYPIMFSDMSGCMSLSYSVMLALWEREKTGKGQKIECSLFNQALAMQMQQLIWIENDQGSLPGNAPSAMASCYECFDDKWIAIVVMESNQWAGLCRVLDIEHLIDDPDYSSYENRVKNASDLAELFRAIFPTKNSDYWIDKLNYEGIPCSIVQERDDLLDDAQVISNKMIATDMHPKVGNVSYVMPPFKMSQHDYIESARLPAPLLGEHTKEILKDLGYHDEEIQSFLDRNIVNENIE
tara:strand:- start:2634 stop:3839 length:1206 start_codon:yes stop_codon:yes gene_type:complete